MEIIEKITEGTFSVKHGWSQNFEGFIIKTNLQEIKVGISSGQNCCENYGYLSTLDDPGEFIGAELINIKETDSELMTEEVDGYYSDCNNRMFITFETSKGTFQITAYNEHNGYYGHDAVLLSKQLTVNEVL